MLCLFIKIILLVKTCKHHKPLLNHRSSLMKKVYWSREPVRCLFSGLSTKRRHLFDTPLESQSVTFWYMNSWLLHICLSYTTDQIFYVYLQFIIISLLLQDRNLFLFILNGHRSSLKCCHMLVQRISSMSDWNLISIFMIHFFASGHPSCLSVGFCKYLINKKY